MPRCSHVLVVCDGVVAKQVKNELAVAQCLNIIGLNQWQCRTQK